MFPFGHSVSFGIAGSYNSFTFIFLRKLDTVFYSSCISLQSHQQWTRVSLPAFAVVVFLILDLLRVLRCSVSFTSHIWLTTFKLLGSASGEGNGNPLQYSCLENPIGWRSLVGCSPWGLEESDTTERLHFDFSLSCTGEGNGTPLQYSCLENPMDAGAWWAAVHGVEKSRTQLSDFTFTFPFHALEKSMATHSSVFAWRIPGMGEPGGLPSMGSHRVGHD